MSLPRRPQRRRRRTYAQAARCASHPDDIERERVVIEAPTTCACCGGSRLAKIGEDVTTLEEIPRRFMIETVREKFTCRD
ncbi:transposase [Bradyrhizobium elkanii]|uniref:Transposase n=1 Tax=Bradyrhizobium elkanii TaxID=29448 RepID=A0ABV4FHI6_BRAEL